MTKREGKALLADCLRNFDCEADLDELVIYKYGNAKEAAKYQYDIIHTDIDFSKENPSAKYIVKCFIHMGIYAAWKREICYGAGKCDVYKKDLVAMEKNPDCYCETLLDTDKTIYWFKGKEGVKRFIKNILLK